MGNLPENMAKNCIRRFFPENENVAEGDRKALKYKAYTETVLATLWGKNDFMDKILINESGLYQMILESKQPVAKEFKRWVVREVIPSIRKHGGYILGQERLDDPTELHKQIEELQAEVERKTVERVKLNDYLQPTERLMNGGIIMISTRNDILKLVASAPDAEIETICSLLNQYLEKKDFEQELKEKIESADNSIKRNGTLTSSELRASLGIKK